MRLLLFCAILLLSLAQTYGKVFDVCKLKFSAAKFPYLTSMCKYRKPTYRRSTRGAICKKLIFAGKTKRYVRVFDSKQC